MTQGRVQFEELWFPHHLYEESPEGSPENPSKSSRYLSDEAKSRDNSSGWWDGVRWYSQDFSPIRFSITLLARPSLYLVSFRSYGHFPKFDLFWPHLFHKFRPTTLGPGNVHVSDNPVQHIKKCFFFFFFFCSSNFFFTILHDGRTDRQTKTAYYSVFN